MENVGFDKSTASEAYDEFHASATARFPAFWQCPMNEQWAGLRPGAPAGVPLIASPPGAEGLYINTGAIPQWRGTVRRLGKPYGRPGALKRVDRGPITLHLDRGPRLGPY